MVPEFFLDVIEFGSELFLSLLQLVDVVLEVFRAEPFAQM